MTGFKGHNYLCKCTRSKAGKLPLGKISFISSEKKNLSLKQKFETWLHKTSFNFNVVFLNTSKSTAIWAFP